jgi:N-acyl-D-aspartate/D-glutamate deacylase
MSTNNVILIKNGTIIDGSGAPVVHADVLINDDWIFH